MKLKTVLGKSLRALLSLCFSLSWLACVGSENLESRVEASLANETAPEITRPKPYAQLITPQTSQRFQHLRKHQGQLLLARENLQLIVSGIPPINSAAAFSPLMAKVYRLSGKTWSTQPWQPLPEFSIRTPEGERLPLVGQDVEASQSSPRIVSIYRSAKAEARVYLTLVPQTGALEVEIQSAEGKAVFWDLRFSHSLGEEYPIPYQAESLAGMTIALLPDASTVVSSVPLKAFRDGIYQSITPLVPQQSSGFYLLLDRASLFLQSRLVAQALACYGSDAPATSVDCLRAAWAPASSYWTLQMPSKTPSRGEKRLMQKLFLHNKKGDFRSVLPIFEGETIKIAQPRSPGSAEQEDRLELLLPDSEGVLQHKSLADDTFSIAPLAKGSLQLFVEPKLPAFVEIRDAVHAEGVAINAWLSIRSNDLFSPHTILQRTWPLQMQIPAGDYQIQVFSGASTICQQRFAVRPEKTTQIRCQDESLQSKLSPRVSLSLDTNIQAPELLQAASIQVSNRGERKTGAGDSHLLGEIPTIEVTDPELGLSLRAFPADDRLRSAWANYRTQREGQRLQDFMSFVRTQDKNLQTILECPAPGFQLEEYEWLALTFAPDILEVFGCLQPEMSEKLLAIAQRLQQKSSKAIKLAAASPLRSLFQLYGVVPAIYMPISPSQNSVEQYIESLKNGLYSLGLRSELEINPKSLNTSSRFLALKLKSNELNKRPGLLRIHDQFELLNEYQLPASSLAEWDLKVPLRLTPRSRWLRVEVLSRGGSPGLMTGPTESDNPQATFLLATSNFLGLDEAPKQAAQ